MDDQEPELEIPSFRRHTPRRSLPAEEVPFSSATSAGVLAETLEPLKGSLGGAQHAPSPAAPKEAMALAAPQVVTVPRRSNYPRYTVLFLVLSLIASLAGCGYLYLNNIHNKSVAERWQNRAALIQNNVNTLQNEIASRTLSLNNRTTLLNVSLIKLKQARVSINSSQGDVKSLEARQRQLVNEKAQVEDQRAQLAKETSRLTTEGKSLITIAAAYQTCKNDLYVLLDHVTNQDWNWAIVNSPTVNGACNTADNLVQQFITTYG